MNEVRKLFEDSMNIDFLGATLSNPKSKEGIKKIKDMKRGEYFTLRPVAEPKESQVFIRGEYDRTEKRYECIQFSDMCSTRYIKGDKEVYTDFIF